jgi:outer membrane protein assembly factor BamE (lipoprotein component of BamABCDE complex)
MKTRLPFLSCLLLSLVVAGCSTVDSRIADNRAVFNTWPPAVQDKVVLGQIDVGFTTDQVRVALGEPDRVFTRTTADGTSQVWSYRDRKPRFGFGIGIGTGSFGHRGGTFGGVSMGTGGGYHDDEKLGVVFDPSGKVASIETRQR